MVANIRSGNGYANKADDLGSLATLFTEHWARAEGKCEVILEDIAEAESIGASILKAMIPSGSEVFDDMRGLHSRAAEYLRRGIEELRDGASYIYRNNPSEMDRYPSLFFRKKRKAMNGKTNGDTTSDSDAPPPTQSMGTLDEPAADHQVVPQEAAAISVSG